MKQYVKPELYLESFELSQHIAGCSLVLQSAEPETCTAQGEVRGTYYEKLFLQGTQVCTCGVEMDAYCYTNGTFSITTINS